MIDFSCVGSSNLSSPLSRPAIGINISSEDMVTMLQRMQLPAKLTKGLLEVDAPPYRSDVLHACDIMEDVAIGYGFNRIPKTVPKSYTIGKQLPINKLSDLVRASIAEAGYLEVLTWALISKAENFTYLRRVDDGKTAVVLSNPVTVEFDVVRTTLLPGLLKTLSSNVVSPFQLTSIRTLAEGGALPRAPKECLYPFDSLSCRMLCCWTQLQKWELAIAVVWLLCIVTTRPLVLS